MMLVRVGRFVVNLLSISHATIYRNCLVIEFDGARDLVLWGDDAVEMLAVLLGHVSGNSANERNKMLADQLLQAFEEPASVDEEPVPF